MILADLHIHSTFSDGKLSIPEVVDLYGRHGFGAIAMTDHLCEPGGPIGRAARLLGKSITGATFPLYREILKSEADRAWQQYQMVVIPGIEITKNSVFNSRSAHLLALGVDEMIDPSLDAIDLSREIRARGGLVIAAHPVHTRKAEKQTYHLWDRRQELAPYIDAWESTSGSHLLTEVMATDLPRIANGDLHDISQFASWKTFIDAEPNQASIFEAIRKQKIEIVYFDPTLDPTFDRSESRTEWRK